MPGSIPAVSAVLLNQKGEALLTQRSQTIMEPGKWCIPGGHFEGGTTWEESIAEEVLEETGLTISNPKLLGLYSDPAFCTFTDPKTQNSLHFVVCTFIVTEFNGELTLNDEVVAFDWKKPDALPKDMIEANRIQILDAARFRGEIFLR